MARDGQWVVWMGMWTSTAVLAPLGAFLTYKYNNDSVAVSYTHLDVYKRQGLPIRSALGRGNLPE